MKRRQTIDHNFFFILSMVYLAGCERSTAPSAGQHQPSPPASATSAAAAPAPSGETIAGYIFNVPVPAGNYGFAARVSYMFPRPWEESLAGEAREQAIWEALILHYESFRRGVTVSDEELEQRINGVLQSEQQPFTRSGDREAYARWVKERLEEDVELFENQMRYLLQIDKLKDQVRTSFQVIVTEPEMQREFLNEQHHVGGEMVTFDSKEEAQAFYEQVQQPDQWEAMKAKGERQVRPVSLMTLEAYMDLWGIPKDQMYAFHAMDVGAIGPPMPFGKQWCVYRLLDKRTGDLKDFPAKREAYHQQLVQRKQYEALKRWIDELKASAKLTILPLQTDD